VTCLKAELLAPNLGDQVFLHTSLGDLDIHNQARLLRVSFKWPDALELALESEDQCHLRVAGRLVAAITLAFSGVSLFTVSSWDTAIPRDFNASVEDMEIHQFGEGVVDVSFRTGAEMAMRVVAVKCDIEIQAS
jgi:hypothetical protein